MTTVLRPPRVRFRCVLGHLAARLALAVATLSLAAANPLERGFDRPPASAQPWVYWFWMDGNLSREGITTDLEAMKRLGIGGVIIMEVDVGIPRGPVRFMSPKWLQHFRHVAAEATRLGIEIDLNAGPGWTGSGGPWITPEQSMQQLTSSETNVMGPTRFVAALPQPPVNEGFYREVAVLAFPTPAGTARISDSREKALFERGHFSSEPNVRQRVLAPARPTEAPSEETVPIARIVDVSACMDAGGRLIWDVPAGAWTILRFGHTSTGANTRPAPEPGLGLECDKFDRAALEAHFEAFVGRILAATGTAAAKSLVSLHIDSWEMGPQNWSARFPAEFQRRRGYDLTPYLPVVTGRVIESVGVSERFLWDLRQTAQELIVDNYAGHLRTLARRRGMRLSLEPYDGTPCDDLTYGARAEVPMCEFWANCFDTFFTCAEATSIAHTYGRRIVAAEAFTADDSERWLMHPATLKPLGDWAFCEGINRLVIHRYAHQPWLDRWPGMTMGPYGVHYERTQTWWELAGAWHQYLARCQFMLQQGTAVADVLYLMPEAAPQAFRSPEARMRGVAPERPGHNFDAITPEALRSRATVRDGQVCLPDGMSYRLLVLPQVDTMTPQLARKLKSLVSGGATIVGRPPTQSPSLSGYPRCDLEVERIAAELWGTRAPSGDLAPRAVGRGQVIAWRNADSTATVPSPTANAQWIWHAEGRPSAAAPVGPRFFRRVVDLPEEAVVGSARLQLTADNAFTAWVNGQRVGEGNNFNLLYDFEVTQALQPGGNVLAVRAENGGDSPNPAGLIAALTVQLRGGDTVRVVTDSRWSTAVSEAEGWSSKLATTTPWTPALVLGSLGMAPWGDRLAARPDPEVFPDSRVLGPLLARLGLPRDFEADAPLRATHRRTGDTDIYFVANPASSWVAARCTFRVTEKTPETWNPITGERRQQWEYAEQEGRTSLPLWFEPHGSQFVIFRRPTGKGRPDPIVSVTRHGPGFNSPPDRSAYAGPPLELIGRRDQRPDALVWEAGEYELKHRSGAARRISITALPPPTRIEGPWQVRFQPGRGAPETVVFERLSDWSKHAEQGVRHFSGVATYTSSFLVPQPVVSGRERVFLDLGRVEVMARVTLNGHDLGVVWKTPFRLDITGLTRGGENRIEVLVANLWPNRLIGDTLLPNDQRVARTTWNPFAPDTPLLESGLLGPVTVQRAAWRAGSE